MGTKCSQSFYDALGGKHRSRELFVVVLAAAKENVTETTTHETYEIVCGMPANEQQLRVDDLAMLFRDERFTVSVHSYLFEEKVPFNPENFRGRQGRAAFDPAAASTLLGKSYPLWLKECARNLPVAPDESVMYSKEVGEEFLKVVSGVGLYYDIAGAPGVLVAGPESFAKRFWGNSGMVDTAARALVERVTPNITDGEAKLLCEYLGSVSPEERSDLWLKALERLGIWDIQATVEAPPLENRALITEDDEFDLTSDLDPPSTFMDGLRARALLLELELGVPDLAAMLGCSSDPEQVRLSVYDLADAAARNRPSYIYAQASADRRAGEVVGMLVKKYGLVAYASETVLHTEGVFTPSVGEPIRSHHGEGVPLAHTALVGLTADGRVFSFEDSDRLDDDGDVTFFSEDTLENCFWHPSVEDAVRGTRGEALGYKQRIAESFENLERSRGGMFERVEEETYDALVASGGEYEGERDARARLIARLAELPVI
jgi:hypothetical protein